jgi:hypothetical protein
MWLTTAKYRKNTTTKVLQNCYILWSLFKYIAKADKNIPTSWQKCNGNFLMWSENKVPVLNQQLYPVLGCTWICSHYLNIHLNHAWHYGTTWLNPYRMQQPTSWILKHKSGSDKSFVEIKFHWNDIACNLNQNKFEFNSTIGLRFNWREMRCKLMEKLLKIYSWIGWRNKIK